MLPKVAAEVAAPLTKAKKITMISDNASELGASKITQEVLDIMNKIPDTVNKMTGVDISQQMANKTNGRRWKIWKKSYEEESAYKILTLLWFFVLLITHDENAEF